MDERTKTIEDCERSYIITAVKVVESRDWERTRRPWYLKEGGEMY